MNSPYMTTTETAAYLGVPVATIYRWRTRGNGPKAAKIGKGLRFRVADVERWIDSRMSDGSR